MTHSGPTVILPLSLTNTLSVLAAKAAGTCCEKKLIEHHIVVVRVTPADTKEVSHKTRGMESMTGTFLNSNLHSRHAS